MTKVIHYLPEINNKFFCNKRGLHAEEALNIVCLDPLCRNDPLGCSICFSDIHKFHRVVSVDKFIDDYSRNIRQINGKKALKKIEKHHKDVKDLIFNLRESIQKELDSFEESIEEYAEQLRAKTNIRHHISKNIGIPLQPHLVKSSKSNEQFTDFLKFILNNSLFDKNNNMVNVTDILKQDQERIYALLDKMVNMTSMCQSYIEETMKSLKFSDETLKIEKIDLKDKISKLRLQKDSFDVQKFAEKQILDKTLANTVELRKLHWNKNIHSKTKDQLDQRQLQQIKLTFSPKYKHQMIDVVNKIVGVSNITALKPQYALLTPHLTTQPSRIKEWSIKINNCRNFASQNTLGIGLAIQKDLKLASYEGYSPKNVTLLTSQGYVIQNGESYRTNLIFGSGDILNCKYDPFYRLLEITKENGRKVSLTINNQQNQQLCACVRLTYASDQVQIL